MKSLDNDVQSRNTLSTAADYQPQGAIGENVDKTDLWDLMMQMERYAYEPGVGQVYSQLWDLVHDTFEVIQ